MIYITGAGGFIGSNLCKHIKSVPLTRNVLDLTDKNAVKEFARKNDPAIIVHCAANPNTKYNEKTQEQLINNINMTYNLLESLDNVHFINISTILVYKDYERKIVGPKTIYGTSKLACEQLCNNFSLIKKIKVTNLRIPATVGGELTHGVVFDIKRKIKESTGEITLFGKEPGSKKMFIHVDDLCKIVDRVIQHRMYGTFDVGPEGEAISVLQIAELAMKSLNKQVKINWTGESWPGDDQFLQYKPEITTGVDSINAIERVFNNV